MSKISIGDKVIFSKIYADDAHFDKESMFYSENYAHYLPKLLGKTFTVRSIHTVLHEGIYLDIRPTTPNETGTDVFFKQYFFPIESFVLIGPGPNIF